jgi:hypothetical protein
VAKKFLKSRSLLEYGQAIKRDQAGFSPILRSVVVNFELMNLRPKTLISTAPMIMLPPT